jgi:hypothetical protein
MGDAEKVRASRDGDKFHYFWAARRALSLLDLTGDLKVVGVEGLPQSDQVVGEEVIDVAEYYGGDDLATCTSLRYVQLKHSTLRTDDPIVASELENTLVKFAKAYRQQIPKKLTHKLHFSLRHEPLTERQGSTLPAGTRRRCRYIHLRARGRVVAVVSELRRGHRTRA